MKKIIFFFLTAFLFSNVSFSNCDPTFGYFVDIDVDNSANAISYTDHQVLITVNTMDLISQGKMNADGSDIRFFDDLCNPLCHSVESGLNTATTAIWVKVTSVPASSVTTIRMQYGNSNATSVENGECTFDFFEDFNDNTFNFPNNCGNVSVTSDGNYGMISWTSSGVLYSEDILPQGAAYTLESMVMGVGGTWPGIYLIKTNGKSYGLLAHSSNSEVRISLTGGGTGTCAGHNWASDIIPYTSADGLWSLTWVATGDLRAEFPTVANFNSTSVLYPLDSDLAVGIGGISSGTGNFMQVDWLRARKFSENAITSTLGAEMVSAAIPTLQTWGILVLGLLLVITMSLKVRTSTRSYLGK